MGVKKIKDLSDEQKESLTVYYPQATLDKYILPAISLFVKNVNKKAKPEKAFFNAVKKVGLGEESRKNTMIKELISDVIADYYEIIIEVN